MVVFQSLPDIDNCCFFIPLRIGCFIIGVWYFLAGNIGNHYPIYFKMETNSCYERLYLSECPQSVLAFSPFRLLVSFMWFIHALGFFASIVFIAGVAIENILCITFFMYIFSIAKIFDLMVYLSLFLMGVMNTAPCAGSVLGLINCAMSFIMTLLISVYLLMVMKSYRSSID